MNENSSPNTLIAFAYPLWIKISFVVCLYLLFTCLRELPAYFKANHQIKMAEVAFAKNDWQRASKEYAVLCQIFPSSRRMKICAAKAFFKSDQQADHLSGLRYIADLSFKPDEWKDIEKCMPSKLKIAIAEAIEEKE